MKSLFWKLAFSGIILAFISCNKNDDQPLPRPNPIPQPIPVPPVAKLVEFKNGDEFIRFEYDAAGKIKKAIVKNSIVTTDEPIVYEVIFHRDGNLATLYANNGQRIEPVYEDDILVRSNYYYDNERLSYTNFHYENGQLKIATMYNLMDSDFEPFFEFRYEYNAAGNVKERVSMIADGTPGRLVRAGIDRYDYDDKASPLYAQKELLAILWEAASKNNVKFEREYDAADAILKETFLQYNYNAAGQPITAAVKVQIPGGIEENTNIHFNYE